MKLLGISCGVIVASGAPFVILIAPAIALLIFPLLVVASVRRRSWVLFGLGCLALIAVMAWCLRMTVNECAYLECNWLAVLWPFVVYAVVCAFLALFGRKNERGHTTEVRKE